MNDWFLVVCFNNLKEYDNKYKEFIENVNTIKDLDEAVDNTYVGSVASRKILDDVLLVSDGVVLDWAPAGGAGDLAWYVVGLERTSVLS